MPYADKKKQKEANKKRQRRYRLRQRALRNEGVMLSKDVTPFSIYPNLLKEQIKDK